MNSQFAVAVHALALLTNASDEPVTSEYMAGSINTNPVFVRRVMGTLGKAGLVMSGTGNGGGWRLARRPEDISLRDVYRAVTDGKLLVLPLHTPNLDCEVGRNVQSALEGYFEVAETSFERELANVSIAQVLDTTLHGGKVIAI